MALATEDIIPITRARAQLTELAEDVAKNGRDKILTRNGESYVAIISAAEYDHMCLLKEREELATLHDVVAGLNDFHDGRVKTWEEFRPRLANVRERAVRMTQARVDAA
jgi:prevent-host-death family protein